MIYTFKNVRHIHGVHYDRFDNALWVTTGDRDNESTIWKMNSLIEEPVSIVTGSQQSRAVQLLFEKKNVYYGTDTPLEKNYVYSINRSTHKIKKIFYVHSSIFYGCSFNKMHYLASVCEPSDINDIKYSRVYKFNDDSIDSRDGNVLIRIKKDIFPMKLFQYGQINFPYGSESGNFLYITPMSLVGDQKTYQIKINSTKMAHDNE